VAVWTAIKATYIKSNHFWLHFIYVKKGLVFTVKGLRSKFLPMGKLGFLLAGNHDTAGGVDKWIAEQHPPNNPSK